LIDLTTCVVSNAILPAIPIIGTLYDLLGTYEELSSICASASGPDPDVYGTIWKSEWLLTKVLHRVAKATVNLICGVSYGVTITVTTSTSGAGIVIAIKDVPCFIAHVLLIPFDLISGAFGCIREQIDRWVRSTYGQWDHFITTPEGIAYWIAFRGTPLGKSGEPSYDVKVFNNAGLDSLWFHTDTLFFSEDFHGWASLDSVDLELDSLNLHYFVTYNPAGCRTEMLFHDAAICTLGIQRMYPDDSINLCRWEVFNGLEFPANTKVTFVSICMDTFQFFQAMVDEGNDGTIDHYYYPDTVIYYDSTAVGIENNQKPRKVTLLSVAPNPFNSNVSINYSLTAPSDVSVGIYDVSGHLVKIFQKDKQSAGEHNIIWRPNNIPSGTYLIILKANYGREKIKAILLK